MANKTKLLSLVFGLTICLALMFGIVFATFGAPAISGLVSSKGYEMNVVFGIGAVFAVIAFVCLTLLGRNLVKEHAEKSAGVKNDTAQVSKPQAE